MKTGILRFSSWDAFFVLMAGVYAVVLIRLPSIPIIAVGIWWTANTIAHNFIHRPFFVQPWLNTLFSSFLTALLGFPQTLWRERHLAHHAGRAWNLRARCKIDLYAGGAGRGAPAAAQAPGSPPRVFQRGGVEERPTSKWFSRRGRLGLSRDRTRRKSISQRTLNPSTQLAVEIAIVCGVWTALAVLQPAFFLTVYMPGYIAGLCLCALQGHYEHAHGATSHYGRIYNLLCFNDGYHVEHHATPGMHWTDLPGRVDSDARSSRWPALLRWLDDMNLETLERLVPRSRYLQRLVLGSHRRALAALVPLASPIERVAIVGGGLFPRTALILRDLLPEARIVIIDADAQNLETGRALLGGSAEFVHRRYEASEESGDFDLVVIPLSFDGRRAAIYAHPPAKAVLVHDWIWRRRGTSRIVSVALFKRLNLVRA